MKNLFHKNLGCPKLTYLPQLDVVKNTFTKELTSKKSALKGYSAYLYGFNGMEKDDEVKGIGSSTKENPTE